MGKKDESKLYKKAEKWVWSEGKRQKKPLAIGALAMLVSSYSNQGRTFYENVDIADHLSV
jgi:hypothetical protein